MKSKLILPNILKEINISRIQRVDYSMEGNWNENLKVLWTREDGFLGYLGINIAHELYKPCIELYFDEYFLGIKCFNRVNNQNVVDTEKISSILEYIMIVMDD